MQERTTTDIDLKPNRSQEAIDQMYRLAFEEGFAGNIGDFMEVISEDQEALSTLYNLAQNEGYEDSLDSFSELMGVSLSKEAVEKELEKKKTQSSFKGVGPLSEEDTASQSLETEFTSGDPTFSIDKASEYAKVNEDLRKKEQGRRFRDEILPNLDLGEEEYRGFDGFIDKPTPEDIKNDPEGSQKKFEEYQKQRVKDHRDGITEASPQAKVLNTFFNFLGGITTTDDRAQYLYGAIMNDAAALDASITVLDRIESYRGEVGNFEDLSVEKFKENPLRGAGNFGAAVLDGFAGFAQSAVVSSLTLGVGLATDMLGGSIRSHNKKKAQEMGMDERELYARGEHEILAPATIGLLQFGLEKYGLDKVMKGFKFVKNSLIGRLLASMSTEGGTEYGQALLDHANDKIAENKGKGVSALDGVGEHVTKNMWTPETRENIWKGMVGGAGARGLVEVSGTDKRNRNKITSVIKTKEQKDQQIESLDKALDMESVIHDKTKSDSAKKGAQTAIDAEKEKIVEVQNEAESIAEKLTPEQEQELISLSDAQMELEMQIDGIQVSSDLTSESKAKILSSLTDKYNANQKRIDQIRKEAEKAPEKKEVKTEETTDKQSYDITNKDDSETVEQKFDPDTDSQKVKVIQRAKRALKAIQSVIPDIKIVLHETDDAFLKSTGQKQVGRGAYSKKAKTIHINLSQADGTTVAHETFHALLRNAVSKGKWEAETRKMLDAIRPDLAPALQKKIDDFVKDYDTNVQNEESVAELFGLITNSQTQFSPTMTQKIKNWINTVSKAMGLDKIIDDADIQAMEVKELLNTLSAKVESGEGITSTEAAQLNEEVREKLRNGIPLENGEIVGDIKIQSDIESNGNDIALQLIDRLGVDTSAIRRGDISDIDGANAFVFAADQAVVGTVKSPTGVVYEFMGGFLYPYIDGTAAWAFTDANSARKVLKKIKESDGVGLVMVQAPTGILGSNSFQEYGLKEIENAINKGADPQFFVNRANEILQGQFKKQPMTQYMIKQGLAAEVKNVEDLKTLLPYTGEKKASYEARNNFYSKMFNATTETETGIPRFDFGDVKDRMNEYGGITMRDIVNDPALKDQEYGDVVSAIQFDKDSPVIDTRQDSSFKTHPSYPFVLTGKPIMVFNQGYDVRKLFPDYKAQPTKKQPDPKPLKTKKKSQAARSAMGGQPISQIKTVESEVSDIVMQKVDKELSKNSGSTQVPNTVGTYKKAATRIKESGMVGTVLDYGAGLGIGTDAMSKVLGTTVSSLEINVDRWKGKQPPTYTKSTDIDRKFDNIVSLNVLNVVPKDVRDGIVDIIASKLNEGGKAYIGVRNYKNDIANVKNFEPGPEPKSIFVNRAGVGRVFQKGWDGNELVEYITDRLGDGYKVEKAKIAATGVIITKGDDLALQKPSKSEKQNMDAFSEMRKSSEGYVEDSKNKKKWWKKSGKQIRNKLYDDVMDRQGVPRRMFGDTEAGKKFVDAMTTRAGHGALASFDFTKAKKEIFGGLKQSEKDLLNEIISARRIVSINENRIQKQQRAQELSDEYGKTLKPDAFEKALQGEKDLKFYYQFNENTGLFEIGKFNEYKQIQNGKTVGLLESQEMLNGQQKTNPNTFTKLSDRATKLFEVYTEQLRLLYESGRIGQDEYLYFRDIEYAPIKVLNKLISDNASLYPDNDYNRSQIYGLSKSDIQKLGDVNTERYAMDHEWVLATTMAATSRKRSTNIMMNKLYDVIVKSPERYQAFVSLEQREGMVPVRFFVKGKATDLYMEPELARQILDVRVDSEILRKIGKATGADILKFFATGANPAFIITNTAIDIANVAFFSNVYGGRLNLKPLALAQVGKDYIKNIVKKAASDFIGKGNYEKVYRDFLLHGGGMDYLTQQGLGKTKKLLKDSGWNVYVDVMSYLGTASEQSVRVSVYQKSLNDLISEYKKQNGLNPVGEELSDIKMKAAAIARNMIDFAQGGMAIKNADKLVPYLNASFQAARRPMQYAKQSPASFAWSLSQAAIMSFGFPFAMKSMLTALMGDEDEAIEALRKLRSETSKYERSNYHLIPTGLKDNNGNIEYIRIKKLPILGLVMTGAEELAYSKLLGEDFKWDSIEESGLSSLPVTGGLAGVVSRNPGVSAAVAYFGNYDLFRRKKISNTNPWKSMHAMAEFDEDTAAIFRYVSRAGGSVGMDISPKRAQAAFEKIFTAPANNPAVAGLYSLGETLALMDNEGVDVAFQKSPLQDFSKNVSRKLIRYSNPRANVYKNREEFENRIKDINSKAYIKDKSIDAMINKQIKEGSGEQSILNREIKMYIIKNFDSDKHQTKLSSYKDQLRLLSSGMPRTLVKVLQERDPEIQAIRIIELYGSNPDFDQLNILSKSYVGRKISSKTKEAYVKEMNGRK